MTSYEIMCAARNLNQELCDYKSTYFVEVRSLIIYANVACVNILLSLYIHRVISSVFEV